MTTADMELHQTDAQSSPTRSRSVQVRGVFENVPRYLNSRGVDIRMRAETVKTWTTHINWRRLLDVGCGDGSVSLPLLTSLSHLTLLDLSSSMVASAQSNVPEGLSANVEFRNENFMNAWFEAASYDVIVSVGVLAHVDSPEEFLAKLRTLVPSGGTLIIEFTDCCHFVGRLSRLFSWAKELIAPPKYTTNRLSFRQVAEIFDRQHLRLVSVFRYANVPVPGVERFVTNETLFALVKFAFGTAGTNRNAWLGNEYICLLRAD